MWSKKTVAFTEWMVNCILAGGFDPDDSQNWPVQHRLLNHCVGGFDTTRTKNNNSQRLLRISLNINKPREEICIVIDGEIYRLSEHALWRNEHFADCRPIYDNPAGKKLIINIWMRSVNILNYPRYRKHEYNLTGARCFVLGELKSHKVPCGNIPYFCGSRVVMLN